MGLLATWSRVRLGLAVQHVGSTLGGDPLPLTYKLGLAFKMDPVLVACDAAVCTDEQNYVTAGMEVPLSPQFSLRAGYRLNRDEGSGLCAGLGVNLDQVTLDYAFAPYGELGDTHRVSVGLAL